jgi:hypothetical protein
LWGVLALLLVAPETISQPFLITQAGLDPEGRLEVTHEAVATAYYVLLRGASPDQIQVPVALALGVNGSGRLSDRSPVPAAAAAFYRILGVAADQPLDTDQDGIDDVYELQRPALLQPLDAADAGRDPDGDGRSHLLEYLLTRTPLAAVGESSPANGERGVAVTRETVLHFTQPLAAGTVLDAARLFAEFGGRRILSRPELSGDRRKATLFYLENLPGSARVRVTLDGHGLRDALDRAVDFDGDGQPGGSAVLTFDTLSLSPIPGTAVIGHVFAAEVPSGRDPGGNALDQPLAGVTITVDGAEQTMRAVTDAAGFFKLEPVPAGRFFVHIDGRTVTNLAAGVRYPDLAYYPFVGKAWDAAAGVTDNLAGGRDDTAAGATGKIYLPLIHAGTLRPVSMTADTAVVFPPEVIAANPALAGVSLTVPANALFNDTGARGGRVGIAPVPPDRLPGPLPPGLDAALVITVQTDGALNFDQPAPICFPNLPDPVTGEVLAPGEPAELFSFNHDKGVWEPSGSMTVSADGKLVCTDPGVGIRQPGWHVRGPAGTRSDPPCFSSFQENLEVVRPKPVREGIGDRLFVGDHGELVVVIRNEAEPLAPGKHPCHPVNRRATPLVVSVTIDGGVARTLELGGQLPFTGLSGTTQFLLPGQQMVLTIRPRPLLSARLVSNALANRLYGNQVSITGHTYGTGAALFEDVFYLYRLFDAGDAVHDDGIMDFEDTFADGPDRAVQDKPWTQEFGLRTGGTTYEMESSSNRFGEHFDAFAASVRFDPKTPWTLLTDVLRIRTPAGRVAGTLTVRGMALGRQRVRLPRAELTEQLRALVDRDPEPFALRPFLKLFPPDSDGDGVRSDEAGFGAKADALYAAVLGKLDGDARSIFGALGPGAADAIEVVDESRGDGIVVRSSVAGPITLGESIPPRGYAAGQTGAPVDIGEARYAHYVLRLGAIDPGVELEVVFEDSPDGLEWHPLKKVAVRSEHADSTTEHEFELVRRHHRARTLHGGAAGGAVYAVEITGHLNYCDTLDTLGCALWADFARDRFATFDNAAPPVLTGGLAARGHEFSWLQRRWLFDQLLNRNPNESFGTLPGGVVVNIDLVAQEAVEAPAAQVEQAFTTLLANVLAHEIGHDLGAIHLRDAANKYIAGDIMGIEGGSWETLGLFRGFAPLVYMALGFPITRAEAEGLWNYYARWEALESYAHNNALPHPNDHVGDLEVPFPVLSLFSAPLVKGRAAAILDPVVRFEDAVADGAGGRSSRFEVQLVNDGDRDLRVADVRLASGDRGFSVVLPEKLPFTIPRFDPADLTGDASRITRRVTVRFDPAAAGMQEDRLLIASDSFGGETLSVDLRALARSPSARMKLDLRQNNAGGVALSAGKVTIENFATLQNDGSQDLHLFAANLVGVAAQQFAIPELAPLNPDRPLVLPPGQGVQLSFEFDPEQTGLQAAAVELESNDPVAPRFRVSLVGTGLADSGAMAAYGRDFVVVETFTGAGSATFRTRTGAMGEFSFFLPARREFHAGWFDAETGLVAAQAGRTAANRRTTEFLIPTFRPSAEPDADHDGLPADVERAVGTSDDRPDTDRDGAGDGDEVRVGTDPLGGLDTRIGLINGVTFGSGARALAVEGRLGEPSQQVAYVVFEGGSANTGIALVDVSDPVAPLILSTLNLPGLGASGIAVDAARQIAVVAAASRGVLFVDVADPGEPKLVPPFPGTTTLADISRQVEILGDFAYAGRGDTLAVIDLRTREFVSFLGLGSQPIDLEFRDDGEVLFARDAAGRLHAVGVDGTRLTLLDSLALEAPTGIGVSGGFVVAAHGGLWGGLITIDAVNPADLRLISGPDNTGPAGAPPLNFDLGGRDAKAAGAGLALTAGRALFGGQVVNLLDVTDPAQTANLVTTIVFPQTPQAIALASGRGLAATAPLAATEPGGGGLYTFNYRAPDFGQRPPVVELLELVEVDADPAKAGVQLLEHAVIGLRARAMDDVAVGAVDLLVNGSPVFRDGTAPFTLAFRVPAFSATASSVTVQARAADTGGAGGFSEPLRFEIVRDLAPPSLVAMRPPDRGVVKAERPVRIELTLDEPVQSEGALFQAVLVRDASGKLHAPSQVTLDARAQTVRADFSVLLEGTYSLVINEPAIRDRAGNALGGGDFISSFSVVPFTAEWLNRAGGNYAIAANWRDGVVPPAGARVFIETEPHAEVFGVQGALQDLFAMGGTLVVSGGSGLNIAGRAVVENLRLNSSFSGEGSVELIGEGSVNGTFGPLPRGVINHGALTAASTLTLRQTTLHNSGVLRLFATASGLSIAAARVNLNGDATLRNGPEGVIELGNVDVLMSGANNLLRTEGGLRKLLDPNRQAGAAISVPVQNSGAVSVAGGELRLNAGLDSNGDHVLDLRDRLTFAGASQSYSMSGTHRFTGGGHFQLNNSTARLVVPNGSRLIANLAGGAFEVVAGTLEVAGIFENAANARWTGGTISVTGEASNAGTLEIAGGVSLTGSLLNRGLIRHTDAALRTLTLRNGMLLNDVTGVYELGRGSVAIGSGTTQNRFENRGRFVKLPDTGSSSFALPVLNSGLLDAGSGTLTLSGGLIQTAGELRLAGGSVTGSRTIDLLGGLLVGSGVIQATVNNAASVEVGGVDNAATLAITGAYTQTSTGSLTVELGGTGPAQFDVLTVSGRATLAGRLQVRPLANFVPQAGDTFKVLSYGSRAAVFERVEDAFTTLDFVPTYNVRDVTLGIGPQL